MVSAAPSPRNILVASDNTSHAALVKTMLVENFDSVFTSTDPDKAVADFDLRMPQVLVLAFNELEKAERYCLGLYRLSSKIQTQALRTVILCEKEQLRQVSDLCIKQSFDDYVLFWPMNHDAPRLRMSVHHALRELALLTQAGPSVEQLAAQARRVAELEHLLDRQIAVGSQHLDMASQAIDQAELRVGTALDGLSRRLSGGELADDAATLALELARVGREQVYPPLRAAVESMQPVKHWVDDFKQACVPHIESARAIGALARQVPPTVLVVDDDVFQHKMVARILEAEPLRLVFAASGAEALRAVGKSLPDLILMDVQMPEMNGIEVTRRLKSVPGFSEVPVIMITGKSEGTVVVDSLKAGAIDFVVKPFDRAKLIAKVSRWLQAKPAQRAPEVSG